MSKAYLFALEYRFQLISEADSLASLNSLHDFCRGFLLALLSAQVVSESEFECLADKLNLSVAESCKRLCSGLHVEDCSHDEQVSADASSSELQLLCVPCVKLEHKFFRAARCAFSRVSSSWAPLPGKRSLVGRESQVCLPSFKSSSG